MGPIGKLGIVAKLWDFLGKILERAGSGAQTTADPSVFESGGQASVSRVFGPKTVKIFRYFPPYSRVETWMCNPYDFHLKCLLQSFQKFPELLASGREGDGEEWSLVR